MDAGQGTANVVAVWMIPSTDQATSLQLLDTGQLTTLVDIRTVRRTGVVFATVALFVAAVVGAVAGRDW
jgi:hypothetical protein